MILKKSQFSILDKNTKDIDNIKDFFNSDDIITKQIFAKDFPTVHRRRDLDSL